MIREAKKHRTFRGTVVSCASQKTVIVRVTRTRWHRKYRRQYAVSRRYPVHDERQACRVGDAVEFIETRPLSKTKRWRIVQRVESKTAVPRRHDGTDAHSSRPEPLDTPS